MFAFFKSGSETGAAYQVSRICRKKIFSIGMADAHSQTFATVEESAIGHKPKSLSFEDAAALPFVSPSLIVAGLKTECFSSTAYMTAAGAIYNDLEIPLPFLPGSREQGFQPDSILVNVPRNDDSTTFG